MNSKILETKFYEVTLEQEGAFIADLRCALFPHAKEKKFWEIVAELYTWLAPSTFELPFQDVMLKTKHGTIDVKKIVNAFDKYPIHFQGSEFHPTRIGLDVQYRFLFDGTLESFRFAHQHYMKLKEFKVKGMQPNNSSPAYKFEELAQELELKPDEDFQKKVLMLCEVGILSCSNCQGNLRTGPIYIGINPAEDFSEWYLKTISTFERILEANRLQFWKRIPIIGWFMKSQDVRENFGGLLGQEFFGTKQGLPRFLQLLIFVLFAILFGLSLYCGLESNWTPCSMFAGGAVALLIAMINKTL